MSGTSRLSRSRRKKSTRWIVLAIVMCSCLSCLAPVLYASNDCSRWMAEYKQGILQRRATRKLRAAKYRLTALVHKPAPPRRYPVRHRMSPLESLKRFQIDCGDLDQPTPPPVQQAFLPVLPVEPVFALISFAEAPPELPALAEPVLTAEVPPLVNVPTTPVNNLPVAIAVTPEPNSLLLVLTGVLAGAGVLRRRAKGKGAAALA